VQLNAVKQVGDSQKSAGGVTTLERILQGINKYTKLCVSAEVLEKLSATAAYLILDEQPTEKKLDEAIFS